MKYPLLIAGALLILLLLVACGDGGDGKPNATSPAATACAASQAHDAGEFEQTIMSGAVERVYILHVPPSYNGRQATPLVLLFHGFALAGRSMLDYSALGAVADREGFLLVAPTGTGDPHRWNMNPGADVDDLLFVNDLLDKLETQLCVDEARVFATGYSNGGGMSMRLACDDASRIKAVGLIAAVYLSCTPKVPLIAFHGTQDPLVAFEGGQFPAIRDAVASWAAALQCGAQPEASKPTTHIELSVYNECSADDGAVQLYVIDGGGHTWPGADLFGDPAMTTQEIDASDLVWKFFAQDRQ